ncbi:MAG: leucine-rich repeat protein, partial [Rikenellaceae bacterium]
LSDEQIDRVDEAVKRLEQAIKIYQDHYPDNHHYIASVYNIWGTILMGDNRAAEAMDLYYIALRIQRETLSEIHFDLADTYINLGTSSLQQGDLDRAMKYYTYAEQIEGSVYHKGHCHKALGCMALIESRFEDAHRELHRALDIYSQHIDKMQIDIIETECYINDLRQRIESAINEDIYMDSEKIIYGVKSDDYGILYTSDLRTILSVPQQIGRSLIGYSKASSSGSYIECYNSVCIPIPESVIAISASAFANNEGLNRVSLPNVTSVERLAFEGCSSLSEVQFADNVTLKSDAFKGCVNIIP